MYRESSHFPFIFSLILNAILIGVVFFLYAQKTQPFVTAVPENKEVETPLNTYAYDSLKKRSFKAEEIKFGDVQDEETEYTSRLFYYEVEGKKVSGLAHIPAGTGPFPVVIMFRGFVDRSIYKPGVGSSPFARKLAENGYITLAPDQLGYGESDMPGDLPLQDRFQTYPTYLQLLADIAKLNDSFEAQDLKVEADQKKIGIWAHSNGGQIALSVLEISGKEYPTVLWAPVSKGFPYSVLYFTDEFEGDGIALRKYLYEFEQVYDIQRFSVNNYFDWIKAPIQLHQGGRDDAVPQKWSDQLAGTLEKEGVDIEYFTYPDSDHNLRPDWDEVAQKSVEFMDEHVKDVK